jgi:hypothetical protein
MPDDGAAEGAGGQELRLSRTDPVAQALVAAIHAGELGSLAELLREHPGLAARMAEYLLALGAELNGTPSWGEATPLDAADSLGTGGAALVEWLRSQGAQKSAKATE